MLVIDAFHARCMFNLKMLILTVEIIFLWKVLMIQIDSFFNLVNKDFLQLPTCEKGQKKTFLAPVSSVLSTDHSFIFYFKLIMKE